MRVRLAFGVAFVAGCANEGTKAVNTLAAFAQQAPYQLAKADNAYSGYHIVVADSALPRYNTVFAMFDSKDSNSATLYRSLAGDLFVGLPIVHVTSLRTAALHGDTSRSTVAYMRPDTGLVFKDLVPTLRRGDTLPPNADAQLQFSAALRRIRAGLLQPDTAFIDVVPGPHIARVRIASAIRDSIRLAAVRIAMLPKLQLLLATAALHVTQFHDFSEVQGIGGASLSGTVTPAGSEWVLNPQLYVSYQVECLGVRGTDSVTTTAYVTTISADAPGRGEEFLCGWLATKEAERWSHIRPTEIYMRIGAYLMRDSIFGTWMRAR